MIFIIIWVLITIVGLFFLTEHYDKKFDELQQLKRSEAYKFGFYILIAYFFIDSTIRYNGIEWCDHMYSFMLGIVICFSFINLYLIATGSMLCPKEKVQSWLFLGFFTTIFSIIFLISSVIRVYNDGIIKDKTLTQSFMQTILFVMYLFAGVLAIIYYFKFKKHEKEETE